MIVATTTTDRFKLSPKHVPLLAECLTSNTSDSESSSSKQPCFSSTIIHLNEKHAARHYARIQNLFESSVL